MKEPTKYWILPDPHFGHDKLIEVAGRPEDFESKILHAISFCVKANDVLICNGDLCFGYDKGWHEAIIRRSGGCKRWLIRGNHDHQTDTWYLNHGWDFVGESATINRYGFKILITHKPQQWYPGLFDINVHGHLHGDKHRHTEFDSIVSDRHRLVAMEHQYRPFDLREVVGK